MFVPFKLRDLTLPNRIVVSPMCQYSAEDGMPDDWHLVHLGSRALGGAGLIMTEMTDVSAEGRITPGCAGLYTEAHAIAWKRAVDFVHTHSPAKIGIQLAHAGRKGSTRKAWEGIDEPLPSGNWPLIAASALPYKKGSQTPRAMTRADMDKVKADFRRATELAQDAGFDILELHMAHGYLLASFLSPLTNRRTTNMAVRSPIACAIRSRSSTRCARRGPPAKPIAVRISATDWKEGGTTPDDAVGIAKALKAHGCDIVDVSAGQTVDDDSPVYGRLFQTPFADRIRHEAGVPTMAVGAISTWADANTILAAGRADLCVLARAHLFDPYWTRHAAQEQGYDLPWPPQYESVRRFAPRPSR
jgi:anthraniloyl-CoA monooxygenase